MNSEINNLELNSHQSFFGPYAFIENGKWGMTNLSGEILLPAQYDIIFETRPNNPLYLIVNKYTVEFKNKEYTREHIGLVNAIGEVLISPKYYSFELSDDNLLASIRNDDLKFGVIDMHERIIVPYGKYNYIDTFYYGLARVSKQIVSGNVISDLWGIIDTHGEEVLPLIYDKVWNFKEKERGDTLVKKDGIYKRFVFENHSIINCPDEIVRKIAIRQETEDKANAIVFIPDYKHRRKTLQLVPKAKSSSLSKMEG